MEKLAPIQGAQGLSGRTTVIEQRRGDVAEDHLAPLPDQRQCGEADQAGTGPNIQDGFSLRDLGVLEHLLQEPLGVLSSAVLEDPLGPRILRWSASVRHRLSFTEWKVSA